MKRKHLISLFTIAIIMIIGSGIFVFRSNITDYICNCEEKPVVYYKQDPALCSDNSTLSPKYTNNEIEELTNWAYKKAKRYVPRNDIKEIIIEASKYDLCLLILAVICEESKFDRYARSSKGAAGLGQIMPNIWVDTLKKEGIIKQKIDLYDYRYNLAATNYVLMLYYNQTSSWKKALNKYVNGSKPYVLNVLSNYAELQFILKGVE